MSQQKANLINTHITIQMSLLLQYFSELILVLLLVGNKKHEDEAVSNGMMFMASLRHFM
jgi:hypothetical protein